MIPHIEQQFSTLMDCVLWLNDYYVLIGNNRGIERPKEFLITRTEKVLRCPCVLVFSIEKQEGFILPPNGLVPAFHVMRDKEQTKHD